MVRGLECISLHRAVLLPLSVPDTVPRKLVCAVFAHCDSERRVRRICRTCSSCVGPAALHSVNNFVFCVGFWQRSGSPASSQAGR